MLKTTFNKLLVDSLETNRKQKINLEENYTHNLSL